MTSAASIKGLSLAEETARIFALAYPVVQKQEESVSQENYADLIEDIEKIIPILARRGNATVCAHRALDLLARLGLRCSTVSGTAILALRLSYRFFSPEVGPMTEWVDLVEEGTEGLLAAEKLSL